MITEIRYSAKDDAETGCGWFAVRRDSRHAKRLPDVSQLFATHEEAAGWARRADDEIRETTEQDRKAQP